VLNRRSFVRQGVPELLQRVGDGHMTGKVRVDQIYAQDQHENLSYAHTDGGGPKFLYVALMAEYTPMMRRLAQAVLDGSLRDAMVINMESVSDRMESAAPLEHGYLRRSGNPRVFDEGTQTYNRPPRARRLSEEEIRRTTRDES
jgi:hypothetical protein